MVLFQAILEALSFVFSWPVIGFVLLGTIIGLVFGALPGLGGTVAIALLIPVTFSFDARVAMVLLAATLGGVAFGGSISAILINTPGTGPNAATMFDGYPMAQQGRANEALAISATSSALGALFGLVVLVIAIPFVREIILSFTPPEFFWLSILGLTIIALTAQGSFLKGIASGGFGLMLSFIGFSGLFSSTRYTFGSNYLFDGIPLIPAIIGLFAVAEIINLTVKGGTIANNNITEASGSVWKGVKTVLTRPRVFFQSAATGTLIGMIPGSGGTVATFLSYMQAVQTSDNPEAFGKGEPSGIIASEAANDAKDGGALLPTVVFGIPGSAAMAVLLGGFIFHGFSPGRDLLDSNLNVLFSLIIALGLSNIFTSLIGLSLANQLSKLTRVPVRLISPAVLTVALVGAYSLSFIWGDVILAVILGFIGYFMTVHNYSRVAVVIALVLGPIMERAYTQSLQISGGEFGILYTRPISIVLIVLTVLSIAAPIIRGRAKSRGDSL